MNKAFEKILERMDEASVLRANSKEYFNNPQNGEYVDDVVLMKDAVKIVQEVAEAYKKDIIYNLAEMYAQNMFVYGVDITKVWETATQQSYALEQAYIRGRKNERDKFNELRKEYKSGWIPCSERLPEEYDSIFAKLKGTDKWDSAMPEEISDDVNVTVEFEDGTRKTMTLHTNDGKWNTNNRIVKFNVIAWQPLPEPYRG